LKNLAAQSHLSIRTEVIGLWVTLPAILVQSLWGWEGSGQGSGASFLFLGT
jgi:hypothetical protein